MKKVCILIDKVLYIFFMNFLLPYSVLLHRLRILEFIILLSVCIYSIHCIYNAGIVTALLTNPQPIIRNEAPVIDSEMLLSYSDVFYAQTKFLCAPPTGEGYGTAMYDRTEVCFLKLSTEDANWIRQKFANVPPGKLLDRNDHLWRRSWNQVGFGRPVLHDDPLEEMYGDDDSEKEHMTTGVVFLKWVTLRLLISQVNRNDLIYYSKLKRSGFSDTKRMLYFIPYDPTIPNQTDRCSIFYCSQTEYYISLQGNFLFRIKKYHSHFM
ncbi:hypothetical protein LEP1GSC075_2598 [Leptospira interrogans str. Kito]|nr:hypothetical protein LEP1GSC069_4112 [Leptospira interrogans serovar Canicola str. Fiocruz LV133]EMK18565.1 hypothetical protein LEP1GSC075_2598 [Leptospira interrogans str. Kito]EMN77684.1 hypothetical protein LEP1GSC102_3500 [Leptospira interrogans str. UI 09600]OQM31963.1 hypothetical protein DV30_06400 [Leptospira interrogans serovar Canicola str. Gui44]